MELSILRYDEFCTRGDVPSRVASDALGESLR
jgi:hypothetical protein